MDDDASLATGTEILLATLRYRLDEISKDEWQQELRSRLSNNEAYCNIAAVISIAATDALQTSEAVTRSENPNGDLLPSAQAILKDARRRYLNEGS